MGFGCTVPNFRGGGIYGGEMDVEADHVVLIEMDGQQSAHAFQERERTKEVLLEGALQRGGSFVGGGIGETDASPVPRFFRPRVGNPGPQPPLSPPSIAGRGQEKW